MSVCWLLIRDGRDDYHQAALGSLLEHAPEPDEVVTIDDHDHALGFTGAVAEGWRQVLATGCGYVLHAELDFIYSQLVEVDRMIAVLERHPHLTQMSLLRQPVNPEEKAAGGVVQAHPEQYTEMFDGVDVWTETDRYVFTTNPSVYSAELCELGWRIEPEAEGRFSGRLRRSRPEARCGIWGGKWEQPRVEHIGHVRAGTGY